MYNNDGMSLAECCRSDQSVLRHAWASGNFSCVHVYCLAFSMVVATERPTAVQVTGNCLCGQFGCFAVCDRAWRALAWDRWC